MPPSNFISLGQRLRRERQRLTWTQEQLAAAIGATSMSINRWEHDRAMPQPYYREQLCRVFNTPADILFGISLRDGTGDVLPLQTVWNVPYRCNPFFTGREDILLRLHEILHQEATQLQAISGLGGIGKTQTAIEYAYRYRDDYHAVLWAQAQTWDDLTTSFVSIAHFLDMPEKDDQDHQRVVHAVKTWLSNQTHWLLILDNVEDLALASNFFPTEVKGSILLTTRTQSTGVYIHRIDLEQMEPAEGALLLLRRAKLLAARDRLTEVPEQMRTAAQDISQHLDGLPLALDQAGAYIDETGCSLGDYLDLYQSRPHVLLDRRGEGKRDHPQSVKDTLSLSIEQVERANPAAADLLRLCAFLHPDGIPQEIFTQGASCLGPVLGPVALDWLALDAAIKDLRRFSLLRRHADTHTFTIHRLVQAVLQAAMDEGTQRLWAERTVRAVNQTLPEGSETPVALWQRFLPHALACAALIAAWEMVFSEAAHLLQKTAQHLSQRAQFDQAEVFFQQSLALWEQTVGTMHPEVAQTFNDLARLYMNQGKYAQAEPLFQQALTTREQILGKEHPAFAQTLNNLAVLYSFQGKYAQAEPLFQQALTIREQALGPTHPHVAKGISNLGEIYFLQGKYAQAEPLFQQTLTIREQTLGRAHPDVAQSLNNLARLYAQQGRHAQAEILGQQALALTEQIWGSVHPHVVTCLHMLAELYCIQRRWDQAERLSQRACTIVEQTVGRAHPDVAEFLCILARCASGQGKHEQAETLFQRAITIQEQQLGLLHPDTVLTREHYTRFLRQMSREVEAAQLEARMKPPVTTTPYMQ